MWLGVHGETVGVWWVSVFGVCGGEGVVVAEDPVAQGGCGGWFRSVPSGCVRVGAYGGSWSEGRPGFGWRSLGPGGWEGGAGDGVRAGVVAAGGRVGLIGGGGSVVVGCDGERLGVGVSVDPELGASAQRAAESLWPTARVEDWPLDGRVVVSDNVAVGRGGGGDGGAPLFGA